MTLDHTYRKHRAHFAEFSKNHELTILHDDGLYRHLRIAEPGTGIYSWNIITWPGHLATSGDVADGYQFARLPDMFEFFRGRDINPQYWAEKMPHTLREQAQNYSDDVFRQYVLDYAAEWRENMLPAEQASFTAAITRDVLDDIGDDPDYNREIVENFKFESKSHGYTLLFSDTWEWDCRDWDYHFIITCQAVAKGISMYDRSKDA